jgi:hypothetical protein
MHVSKCKNDWKKETCQGYYQLLTANVIQILAAPRISTVRNLEVLSLISSLPETMLLTACVPRLYFSTLPQLHSWELFTCKCALVPLCSWLAKEIQILYCLNNLMVAFERIIYVFIEGFCRTSVYETASCLVSPLLPPQPWHTADLGVLDFKTDLICKDTTKGGSFHSPVRENFISWF